ncbi:hypothetical protein DRE_06576 [Drechslerella stenobrocha 248]|uniref:Uncharacterized protein n=1 Tax=Drechslerella stenobrocha 248 TaxID=1043628 RepID=W7I6Y0_9PEZI|nr:hypothetical protein DRE_06576 [Drechslerella stenobrocha 248]
MGRPDSDAPEMATSSGIAQPLPVFYLLPAESATGEQQGAVPLEAIPLGTLDSSSDWVTESENEGRPFPKRSLMREYYNRRAMLFGFQVLTAVSIIVTCSAMLALEHAPRDGDQRRRETLAYLVVTTFVVSLSSSVISLILVILLKLFTRRVVSVYRAHTGRGPNSRFERKLHGSWLIQGVLVNLVVAMVVVAVGGYSMEGWMRAAEESMARQLSVHHHVSHSHNSTRDP